MEQAFGRADSTREREKGGRPNRLSRSLSVQYYAALLTLTRQRNPAISVITSPKLSIGHSGRHREPRVRDSRARLTRPLGVESKNTPEEIFFLTLVIRNCC